MKDLNQEEDSLPLIEDVLGNQEQTPGEMPGLEEPEKEAVSSESCGAEKKGEENSSLCSAEERRHVQRERLNQILLNLLEKIPGKNGEIRRRGSTTAAQPHFSLPFQIIKENSSDRFVWKRPLPSTIQP